MYSFHKPQKKKKKRTKYCHTNERLVLILFGMTTSNLIDLQLKTIQRK